MKQILHEASQEVLDVIPLIMRIIRAQLRTHRAADISVPQLRAMGYIDRNQGGSLSGLASYVGLTLPSMSKLVDGLVARKLVNRSADSDDRRRICLSLTSLGRAELKAAHRSSEMYLSERLAALPEEDLRSISHAMQILKGLFAHDIQPALAEHREEQRD